MKNLYEGLICLLISYLSFFKKYTLLLELVLKIAIYTTKVL